MLIGIDFDNTLVSYERLFHRLACEQGLIPVDFPPNKVLIRDHLRATGREPLWTAMQGMAYGPRMSDAEPFCGARSALVYLRRAGHSVRIISHKTRAPLVGPPHDLHACARAWLEHQGFWLPDTGLRPEHVFFEQTKEAKWDRIASARCDVFIDDLPEILQARAFPDGVRRILFDPGDVHAALQGLERLHSWENLSFA
jgi:hypothetical protein